MAESAVPFSMMNCAPRWWLLASSIGEVQAIHAQLPPETPILHVVLAAEYEQAFKRASSDPTRGISKEPAFLRSQYDHFASQLPLLPRDLLLPVDGRTPAELANDVLAAFDHTGWRSPEDPSR